jgi:starch-binding outer membrane protein, SusD/RagB family
MKKILVCAVLMAMIVSCGKKWLETNPATIQLTDKALGTPEGLQKAIFAVYDFPRQAYRNSTNLLSFIAGTHLVKAQGLLSPDMAMALYNSSLNSTHQPTTDFWNNSYQALNQANAIISRADKVGFVDMNAKNRLVAEARFFRAFILFYLHQRFDDHIPLVTSEVTEFTSTYKSATRDAIYQVITDDLLFAASNLDAKYSEKGRITKGAARHLLAKVYLFRKQYAEAAAMAKAVIDSGGYSLVKDRASLWADNSQDNSEAIYVVQFANNALDGNQQFMAPMFQPLIDRIPGVTRSWAQGARPWARFYPSDYLIKLFDTSDVRLKADYKTVWIYDDATKLPMKILPKGATDSITIKMGDTVKWEHTQNVQYYGPACKKFWEYGSSRTLADAGCRKSIMRYRLAETYLVAAEALWRAGNTPDALTNINVVRARANATPLTDLSDDIILDELARELAFENEDWFALKRMGKLVEKVKHFGPDSTASEITEAKTTLPVPQTFLDATPGYK